MSARADKPLFGARTVLLMVAVGVLAFAGLAVLSVQAPNLRSGDNGGGHALSRSAIGFAGAVKFFQSRGERVLVVRGSAGGSSDGLMVITPAVGQPASALRQISFQGVRLIVLPKWVTMPDLKHKGWVGAVEIAPSQYVDPLLEPYGEKISLVRRAGDSRPRLHYVDGHGDTFGVGPKSSFQTLKGGRLRPVVVDDRGGVVVAEVLPEPVKRTAADDTDEPIDEDDEADVAQADTPPPVYILSDPDLLNTQGLKSLETAIAADQLVTRLNPGGPLMFDATLHGFKRSRNLLSLALEPPFLGGVLCALAAALLAGIGAVVRFGPIRRPPAPFALGKEALVDNTAGLIRMARREHRMGEPYARLCRDLAARAVGAPRQLSGDELEAFLDRLGRQRGAAEALSTLTQGAREARTVGDLITVARKLYDWRLEMTRESR